MGDANPIRTLKDYSKPSHESYRNTIELPVGNNMIIPHGGSYYSCRPQFFPLGRTAKLRNDILMFQQHQGESLSEAWTRFKDLLQKVPHHGIDLWLQVQIFYDHVNLITRRNINQSASGKLRDRNAKESWALLEDLALYDNESWNDPRDFAKPVKAISLPQNVSSTSDRRLIELENQVQCLTEAHLDPTQPTQVYKITTSCDVCSGPHDAQYCMEDPEQAFVEYASSHTNEAVESGYHQKDRKPSQNDKTEHGMEKTVQNQGQSPKIPKVRVNTEESAVKPEPELKNTIGCNLNPSDGPGKPNSITMKTVKTKWALNQFQQPICVQLTKTVKTLKAQS
ncbi:MAK10-like protein [Tanacetum coccineum]|uniref:MAK10-like protein n=1 Tax=Tanacetum coccineum TaxID=301880 RepID=A0ABQ4ZCF6_9ASTR